MMRWNKDKAVWQLHKSENMWVKEKGSQHLMQKVAAIQVVCFYLELRGKKGIPHLKGEKSYTCFKPGEEKRDGLIAITDTYLTCNS